jgi:acyl transferase domain-containing protein/NADP-dependent 3-hydroxy acid dehydrogenase YdfG
VATDPHAQRPLPPASSAASTATSSPTLSAAQLAVAVRRARVEAGKSATLLLSEPIAIVGIGCRFPGGASTPITNVEEYWEFLTAGRSGVREIPHGRWESARESMPPHLLLGGYLDGVELFDAEFFGISPREAHSIDPQQRLLLEVCWEALSDAGISPASLSGSETGVFAAIFSSDYARLQLQEDAAFDSFTGLSAAHSVAAGRLSFLLNLRGPSMALDTACSSSLVATHLACQSLRRQECNMAIVAASSLKLLPEDVRAFAQWGTLASDGRAKTFDAAADGFVPGEGCAVLMLKRLSDAVSNGDAIHAVIRGAAVNQDGRSSVLTAPNGPAQEAVMLAALRDAHVPPQDVTFVETHGTGTSLGDPIEVEALDAVYGVGSGTCLLGAVKTNFGHLEAAAGLAGLIKCVVALKHQQVPPNLNFTQLNPQIRLQAGSRLELANSSRDWRRGARPRFAAVSSFGLSGTNAHVVLEEAPHLPQISNSLAASGIEPREVCLPVSAHTASALRVMAQRFADRLRSPNTDLERLVRATARSRDHGQFRVAVSGSSAESLVQKLQERMVFLNPESLQHHIESRDGAGKVAFVFSGQGSLWLGALENLVKCYPKVEKTLAVCERVVREEAGWSLRAASEDAAQLDDTAKSQPVLFALQILLAEILRRRGVSPDAVTGHSVGEVAAAVTAGVLALEEGIRLVIKRARHMSASLPGRMLAVELGEEEARHLLGLFNLNRSEQVDLAAVNAPGSIVVSGPISAIQELQSQLQTQRISYRQLEIAYAFHSKAMASAAAAFREELLSTPTFAGNRNLPNPAIPFFSTVSGKLWARSDGDANYWSDGIRQPVRFRDAVGELLNLGCRTVIEIGPHPVLLRSLSLIAEGAGAQQGLPTIATIAMMRRNQSAQATISAALAALFEQGASIDWKRVYPGPMQRAELPAYPWERKPYWLADRQPGKSLATTPQYRDQDTRHSFGSELSVLLGARISSPFIVGQLWESAVAIETMPWLGEHRWNGQPILPFAAWLEIARQAAVEAASAQTGAVVLREFAVSKPLEIRDEPIALQTFAGTSRELKLSAKMAGNWEPLASGFWDLEEAVQDAAPLDLGSIRLRATASMESDVLYEQLARSGLTYGSSFRLLRGIQSGPGFALGELAESPLSEHIGDGLHPCLLDASLQTLQAVQQSAGRGTALLPVSVQSYRWLRNARAAYVFAEMFDTASAHTPDSPAGDLRADLTIVSEDGECIAMIRGLRIRRIAATAPSISKAASIWQVAWDRLTASSSDANTALVQRTVLSGGLTEVSKQILQIVSQERIHPGSVDHLTVVTRGAFAVMAGESVDPEQRALIGLLRSFRVEYPAIALHIVDQALSEPALDMRTDQATEWFPMGLPDASEIALREGKVFRPRLAPFENEKAVPVASELKIVTRGLLDTLGEVTCQAIEPAADEVQIDCRAHGLNFRDVLSAMGTYAGATGPFGAECSGVVAIAGSMSGFRTGDAVLAFAPGGMRSLVNVNVKYAIRKPSSMSFAEAATVPVAFLTAHYAFAVLAGLKAGQTVLIHSALGGLGTAAVQLARLAGAAVLATAGTEEKRQLLRQQGIEHVFDSRTEDFAEQVLQATDGAGVDVVLNALSGTKIDAGFRALKLCGAFLEVGKRDIWSKEHAFARRPDARYWAFDLGEVAIDKPDLIATLLQEIVQWIEEGKLTPLPREIYPMQEAADAFRKMAGGRHVGKLVLTREATPLSSDAWSNALRNGTVLITGGTGALGIATARWLLGQDARRVVLISRSGGSTATLRLQEQFAGRVEIEQADVTQSDQLHGVLTKIRNRVDAPLTVVVHAAGVIHDRLLTDQTMETLQEDLHIKVTGAELLEKLTAPDSILTTIYFSSAASILGSAGQAGYAAANAMLDAMAERRSALGLRTLSVQWGAWAGSDAREGMFAKLSEAAVVRALRQGVQPMLPLSALATLQQAILSGKPNAMIADVDWQAYCHQFPVGSKPRAFFHDFLPIDQSQSAGIASYDGTIHASAKHSDSSEIADILDAGRADRLPRMETFLRAAARKVLGLSASRPISSDTPLQELGLDSLMALELRNMLAQSLKRPLSATLLFDHPTIRGLASHLLSLMVVESNAANQKKDEITAYEPPSSTSRDLHSDLLSMSEAEAEELLLAELDQEAQR